MTIETFIEKAIEGKWRESGLTVESGGKDPRFIVYRDAVIYGVFYVRWDTFPVHMDPMIVRQEEILSDPRAWNAVGSALGWSREDKWFFKSKWMTVFTRSEWASQTEVQGARMTFGGLEWEWNMMLFFLQRIEGRSIEKALEHIK